MVEMKGDEGDGDEDGLRVRESSATSASLSVPAAHLDPVAGQSPDGWRWNRAQWMTRTETDGWGWDRAQWMTRQRQTAGGGAGRNG